MSQVLDPKFKKQKSMPTTDLEKGIYTGSPTQILQHDTKRLGGSNREKPIFITHGKKGQVESHFVFLP